MPIWPNCLRRRRKPRWQQQASEMSGLSNLADLYDSQGRYGEAEPVSVSGCGARALRAS
jgi:hypothetical protein